MHEHVKCTVNVDSPHDYINVGDQVLVTEGKYITPLGVLEENDMKNTLTTLLNTVNEIHNIL